MVEYTLKYGTLVITGKMVSRIQREEIYTRNDTQESIVEYCHVVGSGDISNRVSKDIEDESYRAYTEDCPCCYLGFAHSTNKHDLYIKRRTHER